MDQSRRQLIRSLIAGAVGMHLAACSTAPEQPTEVTASPAAKATDAATVDSDIQSIMDIIQKQFSYLSLDPQGVVAFATEYQKRAEAAGPHHPEPEERIGIRYLMSTDFFSNGADETRTVKYRSYHDPDLGCSNPFARFD